MNMVISGLCTSTLPDGDDGDVGGARLVGNADETVIVILISFS